MCVKEFLGYTCGHCSVPFLKLCPLSSSNPLFPSCKYPAERPIHTNEYCHPCARVLWNIKVLREEEEHRGRHLKGACSCEVVFEGEDKERRLRSRQRPRKEDDKHVIRSEHMSCGVVDAWGGSSGTLSVYDERAGMMRVGESSGLRQEWTPEAQMAADEYVGYYAGETQTGISGVNGGNLQDNISTGVNQVMAGQLGAGMRWYPKDTSLPNSAMNGDLDMTTRLSQNARSKSLKQGSHPTSALAQGENTLVSQAPVVVSSDMNRPQSI